MTTTIQTLLPLLAVLVVVAIIARRLNVAPSILLVIAGIGLALAPRLPHIELAPELVLLLILPPLIYSAGVAMSWREFRFNLRPITLLAFGCVVFTTCAVAAVVHWLLGMPLAVAFVLGAIVAPPDVVAPLAIARRLGLPRRLMVVLEGEGLANDATALILYRFAVAAVSTGQFSFGQAAGTFALIVAGEIAYGIGIGWLSLRLRKWARDPRVEITLSLMTPYAAFWVPAHLGGSGVLATIAAGLFVSWNGPLLIPAATRLQGIFFWDLVVYLLEGFVFLVTGLQARTLLDRLDTVQMRELGLAVLLTVVVVIVARFIWVYPATYLPRWLSPSLSQRDPSPPWQWVFSSGVRRRARCRVARCGAGHSPLDRCRGAVSGPRSHSLHHVRPHHCHAGWPGTCVAYCCQLAWASSPRRGRARARAQGGARSTVGCARCGAEPPATARGPWSNFARGPGYSAGSPRVSRGAAVEPCVRRTGRRFDSGRPKSGADRCGTRVYLPVAAGRPDHR